jgi:SAM-dependent methyltransferase
MSKQASYQHPPPPAFGSGRIGALLRSVPPESVVICLESNTVKVHEIAGTLILHLTSYTSAPAAPAFRAEGTSLPLQTACADVVLLSDLVTPAIIAEIARILKPEGVVAGLVRDPSYGDEANAAAAGFPPSQWVGALSELGFKSEADFNASPHHLEFLASRKGLQPQVAGDQSPSTAGTGVLTAAGLKACRREGWGVWQGAWSMTGLNAAIYLLNEADRPLAVKARLRLRHTAEFSTFRIRFNSYILTDMYLSSEQLTHDVELPEFLLPVGGHHLFFDLFPGGPNVELQEAFLEARPAGRRDLTEGLPFDLFQRYQLTSQIAERLPVRTILDVGGYLGDRYGHLAFSGDFFNGDFKVTSTDLRACDHPGHRQADACSQPFPDRSFDLVLSMDVLEHLPTLRREAFLEELLRLSSRYTIVAAPFSSPEVTKAEEQLLENLLAARPFLQEHRELGLPEASWLERFFSDRGCFLYRLPSGYLPRWTAAQVMANHYSQGGDYLLSRAFNRLYNRSFFPFDQLEPAYRTIFLISRERLSPQQVERIGELRSPSAPGSLDHLLSGDPLFFEIHSRLAKKAETKGNALSDAQFLANARQEYIRILQRELRETPLSRLIWRRLRGKGGKK